MLASSLLEETVTHKCSLLVSWARQPFHLRQQKKAARHGTIKEAKGKEGGTNVFSRG